MTQQQQQEESAIVSKDTLIVTNEVMNMGDKSKRRQDMKDNMGFKQAKIVLTILL